MRGLHMHQGLRPWIATIGEAGGTDGDHRLSERGGGEGKRGKRS